MASRYTLIETTGVGSRANCVHCNGPSATFPHVISRRVERFHTTLGCSCQHAGIALCTLQAER